MPSKRGKKHAKRKSSTRTKGSGLDDLVSEPETTFCSSCTKSLVPRMAQDHLSALDNTGKTVCLGSWENTDKDPCSLCKAFRSILRNNLTGQKYYVHALQAAQMICGDSVLQLETKVAPEHYPLKFEDSIIFALVADEPEPIHMMLAVDYAKGNDFLIACSEESDVPQFLDTSGYDHSHELWISEYEHIFKSTRGEWRHTSIRAAINQADAMGFIYEVCVDEDDTTYGRPIRPVTKSELERRRGEGIKHIYTTVLQPFEMGDQDMPRTSGYVPQSVRRRTIPPIQDLITNTFRGRVVNSSRIDYSLLRAWFRQCRTTCKLDKFVRDQKRFGQIHFCLIDVFSREIIEVGAKRQVKYIALSYVWGGVSTDPRIDDWETLPILPRRCVRVVEDALKVVKELGFRYLWVDSYCISKDAGLRHNQIANMDLVYKNAELTIVAAAGHDAAYGLPGVGDRSRHGQQQVMNQDRQFIVAQAYSGKQSHASSYSDRGWTYQEFFFSRRRLVFTDFQVIFECQHRCHALHQQECLICPRQALFADMVGSDERIRDYAANDLYLKSIPRKYPDIAYHADGTGEFPMEFNDPKYAALRIFEFHVREYTQRQLSFDEDSLQAVESILNRFSNGSFILYHLHGLPYHPSSPHETVSIRYGLLWTHGPRKTPLRRRLGFPSWSWTGWEGEVNWLPHDLYKDRSPEGHGLNPAQLTTFSVSRQGYENDSSDRLVDVNAWRFFESGHVHPTQLHFHSRSLVLQFRFEKDEHGSDIAVHLDHPGYTARLHLTRVAPTEDDFKLRSFYGLILRWGSLPSRQNLRCAYVLVVQLIPTENGVKADVEYYERVGVMVIPRGPNFWQEFSIVAHRGVLI